MVLESAVEIATDDFPVLKPHRHHLVGACNLGVGGAAAEVDLFNRGKWDPGPYVVAAAVADVEVEVRRIEVHIAGCPFDEFVIQETDC
jgi:hypothetical protein